jgi:hypothetical protein
VVRSRFNQLGIPVAKSENGANEGLLKPCIRSQSSKVPFQNDVYEEYCSINSGVPREGEDKKQSERST